MRRLVRGRDTLLDVGLGDGALGGGKAAAVLIFAGIVAPAIGLGLKRMTRGWDNYGAGPFSIHRDPPGKGAAPAAVDPAIQAAEVRQMLEAKSERRRERGEPALDVEAESARLLAADRRGRPAGAMTRSSAPRSASWSSPATNGAGGRASSRSTSPPRPSANWPS